MNRNKTVRTFIGVEISEDIREEMSKEISYLKSHFPHIKWVNPLNIHLTLKFIGNVITDDLREIFQAAEAAAQESYGFSLEVCGVNAFPDPAKPVVISAGCQSGIEGTVSLANILSKHYAAIGYPPEQRPFQPHFTLGRIKQPSDAAGFDEFSNDLVNVSFGILDIEEITVFMSELKKSGARHTPMQRIKLK